MKKLHTLILLSVIGFCFTDCATIVSKSSWPFSVDSDPRGADILITNKKGQQVYTGHTPAAFTLKSGAGYFSKEIYTIRISKEGYTPKEFEVTGKLNGWYIGNIVFGAFIGFLIIDPITGAMWKLDTTGLDETLEKSTGSTSSLKIYLKEHIPRSWETNLVRIN